MGERPKAKVKQPPVGLGFLTNKFSELDFLAIHGEVAGYGSIEGFIG